MFKKTLIALAVINIIFLDAYVVFNWVYPKSSAPVTSDAVEQLKTSVNEADVKAEDVCGENCKAYIDQKISESSPHISPTPVPTSAI